MSTRHRTPLLGNLRSYPDPTASVDPRVRLVVAQLRTLSVGGSAPGASFRAELRQQLVAVAPRLIAEGVTARPAPVGAIRAVVPTVVGIRSGMKRTASIAGHTHPRRPVVAGLGATVLFVMLVAGVLLMSGRALPGDSLYGVKRAGENVHLSLTAGNNARAKDYLEMARTRADEISELLSRSTSSALGSGLQASGGLSHRTSDLIMSTLNDQDSEVRSAARLLGASAVDGVSANPLRSMMNWAPGQLARMREIAARIPAGALHDRAAASGQVTQQALKRAQKLDSVMSLPCASSTSADDFGPIPVSHCVSTPTPSTNTPPTGSAVTSAPTVLSPSGALISSGPAGSADSGPNSAADPNSNSNSNADTTDTDTDTAPTMPSDPSDPSATGTPPTMPSDPSVTDAPPTLPTDPTVTDTPPTMPSDPSVTDAPPTMPTDPTVTDSCADPASTDPSGTVSATCEVSTSPAD
jgi:Domain of unknown function (DUF5667)